MMGYTINKYHGEYNRVKRTSAVKFIVVHYVGAGTSAVGNAKNNCIYFSGGNRNASAHYFIDDGSIYEYADPKSYSCWHVGDGGGKYKVDGIAITNQNSIGIEVCVNGDVPFTNEEIKRLTWLVQKLMNDFNVPASRVVRHYDASRKTCPRYYVNRPEEWKKLHDKITGQEVEDNGDINTPSVLPSTTPNSNDKKPAAKITVDGVWGKDTTIALQKALNAPYKDGIISRQSRTNKKYLAGCTTGWEFKTGIVKGSQTIELLQKKLGMAKKNCDGVMGKDTVKALQKYLGTYVDGYLDNPSNCIKELQRRLNAGTF